MDMWTLIGKCADTYGGMCAKTLIGEQNWNVKRIPLMEWKSGTPLPSTLPRWITKWLLDVCMYVSVCCFVCVVYKCMYVTMQLLWLCKCIFSCHKQFTWFTLHSSPPYITCASVRRRTSSSILTGTGADGWIDKELHRTVSISKVITYANAITIKPLLICIALNYYSPVVYSILGCGHPSLCQTRLKPKTCTRSTYLGIYISVSRSSISFMLK